MPLPFTQMRWEDLHESQQPHAMNAVRRGVLEPWLRPARHMRSAEVSTGAPLSLGQGAWADCRVMQVHVLVVAIDLIHNCRYVAGISPTACTSKLVCSHQVQGARDECGGRSHLPQLFTSAGDLMADSWS